MANVTAVVKTTTVTLQLTEAEARSIATICGFIGGDRHGSIRRHFAAIDEALEQAGIAPFPEGYVEGSITALGGA